MLELKEIKKVYDMGDTKVEALKGITANFGDNEFVSILGPSGCGKTTLLNIIGGLDKYTSGDLVIDGKSTKNFNDGDWDTYRNHKIGFVFQSYNLIQHLSVLENVEMSLSLNGISKQERREKATKALERVGLSDQIKKMPNQLSGGQMQRVAIARAIVNDPSIILADEPTGALDSKTSKQILELLKEISNDKLIIMVTHNASLAKKYSTRIIKLLDGEISGDNTSLKSQKIETKKDDSKKTKKSAMNFWTALYLSFKNLLTKKGRTILTSFAGSIGIIGVALVLSISNGFSLYINNLQQDTLSNYPISIATATVDFSSLNYNELANSNNIGGSNDAVTVTGDMSQYIQYGHYNCINENFLNTIKDFEKNNLTNNSNSNFALIEYNYFAPTKFLIKQTDELARLEITNNSISLLSASSSNLFFPSFSDESYIMDSYKTVYTSNYYDKNDIFGLTLVLSKGNKISYRILNTLGIFTERDETNKFKTIDFDYICENVKIQLLYNDDFYVYDDVNDKFNVRDISNSALLALFDSNTLQNLKITRIIAPKDESNSSLLSTGIMYSYDLQQAYLQNCEQSEIAQKQAQRKVNEENQLKYNFYVPLALNISEVPNVLIGFDLSSTQGIEAFLQNFFKTSITKEEAYQMGMQQIGISTIPQSITFYPKNFSAKEQVTAMVDEYNANVGVAYQIIISDGSEFLTNTLGTIINIISIVLVAFASISLVVSSIMIGIITYVSVIERTKEIGILRSIGARKKDISHIFNAETLIIGALSGAIGVLVTYLICPLINMIVANLADIQSIANFSPIHALSLVFISTILTLISGSIPSKIASKKDPVECLRTE